jgi:hypothetical protein
VCGSLTRPDGQDAQSTKCAVYLISKPFLHDAALLQNLRTQNLRTYLKSEGLKLLVEVAIACYAAELSLGTVLEIC